LHQWQPRLKKRAGCSDGKQRPAIADCRLAIERRPGREGPGSRRRTDWWFQARDPQKDPEPAVPFPCDPRTSNVEPRKKKINHRGTETQRRKSESDKTLLFSDASDSSLCLCVSVVQRSLQFFTASSRLERIPAQQRAGRRRLWTDQAIENMDVKRIAFNISCVFYKMGHFKANESFCETPFIICVLGSGWPEKFVRATALPIAKLVGGCDENSNQENPKERKQSQSKANELNAIIINEVDQKWEKQSQGSYPASSQSFMAIWGPVFEKLVPIHGFSIADLAGRANKP
jgi:hypothetical protein